MTSCDAAQVRKKIFQFTRVIGPVFLTRLFHLFFICSWQPESGSRRTSLAEDILPEIVFSHDVDPKERARHIEHQMNEQAKVVQDLK